jgi:small GTP-binding protein
MTELPASSEMPPTAVIFIGNIGAGKSTLLTQLGGNFHSDVGFMEGVTKEVSEQTVLLDGEPLILMDTPGLHEISKEATKANAEKLTRALEKGYEYKLFIVLAAHNRGLQLRDLALISAVNKSVRQANGANVEFGIIVNQIEGDAVYNMYAKDFSKKLQRLRGVPILKKYGLDIQVGSVTLVRFEEEDVLAERVRDALIQPIKDQVPTKICLSRPILTQKDDQDEGEDGNGDEDEGRDKDGGKDKHRDKNEGIKPLAIGAAIIALALGEYFDINLFNNTLSL